MFKFNFRSDSVECGNRLPLSSPRHVSAKKARTCPRTPKKHLSTLPIFLAVALALEGCTLIPTYRRPEQPTDNVYPGANGSSGKNGAPSQIAADEIGWREFFDDPRLQRIIELTLDNNRDLRVAALNTESASAQYRIQRAALFPTINASGTDYETRSAANGTTGTTGLAGGQGVSRTSTQYSVSLGTSSYEVDLFGRVRSLKSSALNKYLASDEARRSTQLSLVAQVAAQYLTERALDAQLGIARETLKAVSDGYALTKQSFEGGVVSALDLASNDGQVQTARANLADLELRYGQAKNAFVPLIGAPLPADLPPPRPLASTRLLADISAGLPSDLIQRRPDILSAEFTLKAANADIGAARAAFFPSIALTASGGNTSGDLSKLFTRGTDIWTFSPTITLPIFTGGSNLANLDVANLSKRIEIANYEKAIQTAFQEVADALVARTSLDTQVNAYERLVAAQKRRYDLSELRYRSGLDSYITFLLAQQDLYSAQQSLVTAQLNRLTNLITLYKALGGGWKT